MPRVLDPIPVFLFALTKYAHFLLYPIHLTTLVNYRSGSRPSGAKSDPSDASLLLDLLVRHRDKLRRLNPDTVKKRTLKFLVEGRRKLISDKTRYSNRLTACLKMYFPRVLDWFDEVSSQIPGDFLALQKVQKARRCWQRPIQYLNNILEQDHRAIKRRVNAKQGFREFQAARRTIQDYEAMHMIRKGQARWRSRGDVRLQAQFIHKLFELSA
jgi:transposase-like protein